MNSSEMSEKQTMLNWSDYKRASFFSNTHGHSVAFPGHWQNTVLRHGTRHTLISRVSQNLHKSTLFSTQKKFNMFASVADDPVTKKSS